MEVAYSSSALERNLNLDQDTTEMELDSMDLDIDLGSMDDFNEPLAAINTISEYAVPSSHISDSEMAPTKVYIRGLEDLTTSDIKIFAAENHPSENPPRIEWIDDTSANLVFQGEEAAMTALQHLTLPSSENELLPLSQLRAAKKLSTHPESLLYVRIAAITDQKRPRAYEASRFYMMHPEHDPREVRRRGASFQGKGDYRRKGYSDDEHQRRRRKDKEDGFDASMYDDDDGKALSRRGSISSSANGRGNQGRLRGDSYRPAREERNGPRSSRDRSASPNGRNRHTSPPSYRSRDPHPFPRENKGKELFPSMSRSSRDADRNDKDLFRSNKPAADLTKDLYSTQDLFSNKMRAAEVKKELFPHKLNPNKHSRSDAFDAADETADLFANGMSVPFADGSSLRKSPIDRLKYSDPQSHMDGGDVDIGMNIRGASREQNQGLLIRGGAAVNATGTIKELFPGKSVGNAGKELFADKVEGRGARRNRAEDMFY
ncbi:hypothetical protein IMSHALPRED_006998 [Imshaugia aleurites]|uniref:Uncharacterized protein n=1 Tax=Imshaugia aleurites TaxID=172621 RepID=A0A8H3FL23_9LECA|nr:hypothetical protein IMSHALPRED_006998 [Imshaugia aleurites]